MRTKHFSTSQGGEPNWIINSYPCSYDKSEPGLALAPISSPELQTRRYIRIPSYQKKRKKKTDAHTHIFCFLTDHFLEAGWGNKGVEAKRPEV
jgi:hypothetical protein